MTLQSQKKFHKQAYSYKHQDKAMSDVDIQVAQKVVTKLNTEKPFRVMSTDNGRMIVAFMSNEHHKQYSLVLQMKNQYGDAWIQFGEEKVFEVSENSTIVIAEFWTEDKMEYEESVYIDGLVNFHFDIKEDTGVYRHPFDVYSPSELI